METRRSKPRPSTQCIEATAADGSSSGATATKENSSKSIVVLTPSDGRPLPTSGEMVQLPDAFADGHKDRMYVLFASTPSSCDIFELSSIQRRNSFNSFFVNDPQMVVANGSLHMMNKIDPLFLLLHYLPTDVSSTDTTWQPLMQIMTNVPLIIQKAIDTRQLNHFFQRYQDDDLVFYKFLPKLALQWLASKHSKVFTVLSNQLLQRKRQKQQEEQIQPIKAQKTRDGAFSSSFRLEDSFKKTIETPDHNIPRSASCIPLVTVSTEEKQVLHASAMQIVCRNVSQSWRRAFLSNLSTLDTRDNTYTEEDLWSFPTVNGSVLNGVDPSFHSSVNLSVTNTKIPCESMDSSPNIVSIPSTNPNPPAMGTNTTTTKAKTQTQSLALKQLAKVNTKGMKTMERFFQKPKDKK